MTNELTNLKALEKEAGIPAKTLAHFIKGRRMLPVKHLEKLIPVLVDL